MKRKDGIDVIKAIAIFCVLLAHTCSPGYYSAGFDFYASVFWGSLFRMAVPLFLMCTGALLLDPEREFNAVPFLKKNYLRILIALFFWAAMYKLYHLAVGKAITGNNVLYALKELALFKHEFHLYYLHIVLLLYAFLPVLRVLTKHAGKGMLIYILVLWALTGIVYPTLRPFWPFRLLDGVPAQWLMNMTWASFGYALLGHFLMKYPMKRWLGAVLFIAGFAVVFGGTLIKSRGGFYEGFLEGMSIGVALKAAGLFVLLSGVKLRRTGFVRYIAKASFCAYLIHIFIISEAARLGWSIFLLPCAVSIPVAAAVTLAVCCGIYYVLSKIPLVKKYLV
jgi:surface polysaccharide O-acyltransferase-like enzyme